MQATGRSRAGRLSAGDGSSRAPGSAAPPTTWTYFILLIFISVLFYWNAFIGEIIYYGF
jgi:hypothetical protein